MRSEREYFFFFIDQPPPKSALLADSQTDDKACLKRLMKTPFEDEWAEKYAVVLHMSNSKHVSLRSQTANTRRHYEAKHNHSNLSCLLP